MRAYFTGFEPFGEHAFNPSAVVAEEAARVCDGICEILPVDFETARTSPVHAAETDLAVHFGLAAATPWVRLERYGHNLRMQADDPSQERDPDAVVRLGEGPLALETSYDVGLWRQGLVEAGFDVRHSRDAGTYVCNALYYHALSARGGEVLFVHVPAWEEVRAVEFGRAFGELGLGLG